MFLKLLHLCFTKLIKVPYLFTVKHKQQYKTSILGI